MEDIGEFVRRATQLLEKRVAEQEKINYENQWLTKNPIRRRELQKKYDQTEKGKIASKVRSDNRAKRFKEASKDLTHEDLENIRNFYVNCPAGYEVDHIIPISKGGLHILSNLQYLTPEENRKKGARIL